MNPSLAELIREGSRAAHEHAEQSPFVEELMSGRLQLIALRELLTQTWFIYEALEAAGTVLAEDPIAGPFVDPALERLPALERDLTHLHGTADWRNEARALPATERYAARIRTEAHRDPVVFVAHHYTRYLGDLSGGQIVRRKMQAHYGLDFEGLEFYHFVLIPKTKPYKDGYRSKLDQLPVDGDAQRRLLAEVNTAFALNSAVFADLGNQLDRYCAPA